MSIDTGDKFLEQFKSITDPISKILVIHLYCERGINKLIEVKGKKSEKISQWKNRKNRNKFKDFNPLQNSNFVTKIYFAYNMEWINEGLYNNLYLLNTWRNEYAHNIDVDLEEMNYDFDLLEFDYLNIKDKKDIGENLEYMAIVTIAALHKCLIQEHNLEY